MSVSGKTRKSAIGWLGLAVLLTVLSACQTASSKKPLLPAPPAPAAFDPLTPVVTLEKGEGQYPTLFTPTSYAVWVTPEVAALKHEKATKEGPIEPWVENDARVIPSDYIVIECHVESATGDASVAYDAVSFRGFDVYLEVPTDAGMQRVEPVQVVVDPHMQEGQRVALKTFARTNLIVIPRVDVLRNTPTIPPTAQGARLVLDGLQSKFVFNWPSANGQPQHPVGDMAAKALNLGFRDLYSRLSALAHLLD